MLAHGGEIRKKTDRITEIDRQKWLSEMVVYVRCVGAKMRPSLTENWLKTGWHWGVLGRTRVQNAGRAR